jgi:OOP family OmpA-OmpF porin
MKKHAIVLAALLGATAAQSQVYVNVAAGASHLNTDCTGVTSCDSSDTGTKLVGGYDFGNGFSLEAGYVSFGKFRAADGALTMTAKPTAFTLGGAYALPLSGDWGLAARLGLAQVKTKLSAAAGGTTGSDSESKAKVYAGLGLTYAVSKTVKLELGLDSTEAEYAGSKGTLRLISLGASFAF